MKIPRILLSVVLILNTFQALFKDRPRTAALPCFAGLCPFAPPAILDGRHKAGAAPRKIETSNTVVLKCSLPYSIAVPMVFLLRILRGGVHDVLVYIRWRAASIYGQGDALFNEARR